MPSPCLSYSPSHIFAASFSNSTISKKRLPSASYIRAGTKLPPRVPQELHFNHDGSATKKLQAGVDMVADLVGVTLGPKGRNVVLQNKYGTPKIVNDGVTVLKQFWMQMEENNPKTIIVQWIGDQEIHKFHYGAYILWNLWKMRNDVVFSNVSFSAGLVVKQIVMDFSSCHLAISRNIGYNRPNIISHYWNPLEFVYGKTNYDAAFIQTRVIAKNHSGLFQGCGTPIFDANSALTSETKAVILGLSLAKILNLTKIIVEGDASEIPWIAKSLILKIKVGAETFSGC